MPRIHAHLHMHGEIARPHALVHTVQPCLEQGRRFPHDVRAGNVHAVARVFRTGEIVAKHVEHASFARLVEKRIERVFRAAQISFEHEFPNAHDAFGISPAPHLGVAVYVGKRRIPLGAVVYHVHAHAAEADGGFQHEGLGRVLEIRFEIEGGQTDRIAATEK